MGWIIAGICVLVILPPFIFQFCVSRHLFRSYFSRSEKESWTRELKATNEEEERMFAECRGFEEKYGDKKQEVEVTSDGFRLKGEYYGFGGNRAVIIVGGRTEALRYCYYYAAPYVAAGCNVLVIDNRSHGESEGKYNALGLNEYRDIIAWSKLLHERFGNEYVIGHGICIGSATLLYADVFAGKDSLFRGLVTDGMFVDFPTSFNNHSRAMGYGVHFVSEFLFLIMRIRNRVNPYYGPKNCIDKYEKPILMLCSREDIYSTLDKSRELFSKCRSVSKEMKVFETGAHSHIRVNNREEYDEAIIAFLEKNNL